MSSLRRPDSCKGHAELGTMSVMIATDDILISVKRRNMLINHSKGRNYLIYLVTYCEHGILIHKINVISGAKSKFAKKTASFRNIVKNEPMWCFLLKKYFCHTNIENEKNIFIVVLNLFLGLIILINMTHNAIQLIKHNK